ncbi:hypothetical protein OHW91_14415, partial [Acinetobacter baumannii]|nr:hypothetical protein [Acinetobacter baumannii]
YIITSDGKINFKEELLALKDFIIRRKTIKIQSLINEFKEIDSEKLEEILYYLAMQNFIEVIDI